MNTSITENVDIIVFLSMFNNIGVFGQMCLNVQEISLIVSKMCPNVHIFTFGAVTPNMYLANIILPYLCISFIEKKKALFRVPSTILLLT